MQNKLALPFFCLLLLSLKGHAALAAPLTLDEVLFSANAHYPKIKMALLKEQAAESKIQAAQGAFDLRFDGEVKHRGSGYYDGSYSSTTLVKPLAPLNAELYGGWRRGDGTFPVYNQDLQTRDEGEVHLGAVFSLLKDRDFDERRFAVQYAVLDAQAAHLNTLLERLETQRKAMYLYGEWLAAGHRMKIYRNLYQIADLRQRNLLSRIASGDAASIAGTENEQNLLKRQMMVNEAQQDFTKASNALSLYWRDTEGKAIIAAFDSLPAAIPKLACPGKQSREEAITRVVEQRPEIALIETEIARSRSKMRIGENDLLPKLQLGMEVSKDYGAGPEKLGETEAIASVKMSIPLQRNKGKGKTAAALAEMRQLEQEQLLLKENLRAELANLAAEVGLYCTNITLSQQEMQLADKMQHAENDLLSSGASNLFLVNSREEKATEAQLKNVYSYLNQYKALANYYAATLDSTHLKL